MPSRALQLQIGRDILMDGAALLTGSNKTVCQGNRLLYLPGGKRLHRLHMMGVGLNRPYQSLHLLPVHARKGSRLYGPENLPHLLQPLIAAGLQQGGGHGHRPDARVHNPFYIKCICSSRVGDAQSSAKILRQLHGHRHGQGIQGLPGHIHLLAGKLAVLHVHREGIGNLYAKLQPPLLGQGHQTPQHGNRVLILQIILKMELSKCHVIIAHSIHHLSGILVPQKGGIALDKGMNPLYLQKIPGNALNLLGRTSVKRRECGAVRNPRGHSLRVLPRKMGEALRMVRQPLAAFLKNRHLGGVLHPLDKAVDFLQLNALQVVAHGHIELESVRSPQAVLLCQKMTGKPGLHVLVKGLRHIELRGPLAVIALIIRLDAGLRHRQVLAVNFLHGLQLEKPGAGRIGRRDILGQLGVRPSRRPKGRLQLPSKDCICPFRVSRKKLTDAENTAPLMLRENPFHQLPKGHGCHSVTHIVPPIPH